MAAAVTAIALASLWLISRSDRTDVSAPPPVATAASDDGGAVGVDAPIGDDLLGSSGAAYLDVAPAPSTTDVVPVAVPPAPKGVINAGSATYRSDLSDPIGCLVVGAPYNRTITITNLDNNRSVECQASVVQSEPPLDDVILPTAMFLEIADLTDAPIPVEINW